MILTSVRSIPTALSLAWMSLRTGSSSSRLSRKCWMSAAALLPVFPGIPMSWSTYESQIGMSAGRRYNHHRSHTALKGEPPISRVNNLAGNYN
jgi:hypothetical protein